MLILQVKRFKKMLQKADCNSCPTYSASSEVIESLRSVYTLGTFFFHFQHIC